MGDFKVEDIETRSVVVCRRFLDKLDLVRRRKPSLEGQTPDSVTARLQRYLSDKTRQQSAGS